MAFVEELKKRGHRVFLDLKLYDIGETVRRAVVQVARAGVDFLTVHAVRQAMRAAVAGRGGSPLKLLGVTVLTSVDDRDLLEDGYTCGAADLVEKRVKNAMEDGFDGIVCSGREVATVRKIAGPRAILVIPGVRSSGAATDDQKRLVTPAEAVANGADFIVIGRQITRSGDPRGEMLRILDEVSPVAPSTRP